jgi:pantetheine-phosphate adenylyltransferase
MTVIYPGSFDPLTLGHEDIIARAVLLFDRVIVAVAQQSGKPGSMPIAQRVALIQRVCQPYPTVDVISFDGLLIELLAKLKVTVVIRGVRNYHDWDYEHQQFMMNQRMMPAIETIVLPPKPELQAISSTLVRQIAALGGDVRPFVSLSVAEALAQRE